MDAYDSATSIPWRIYSRNRKLISKDYGAVVHNKFDDFIVLKAEYKMNKIGLYLRVVVDTIM